jgi:hypothetical protein
MIDFLVKKETKMTDKEIQTAYNIIADLYKKNLEKHGVKSVNLKLANGKYTMDALVLVRLSKGYPHTSIVSKNELTLFVRQFYPDVVDVQQARHLSKQKGYNIISGTRGDITQKIPAGSYKLVDLVKPYPGFKPDRREGIEATSFNDLKKQYNNRCATCGSVEGKPHNIRTNEIRNFKPVI